MKNFFVYILTNKTNKVLYIGVTNNLLKRVWEHKNKLVNGFTKKYNCTKLVYFEQTENVLSAIRREKQLKNWHRQWKLNLIGKLNPKWNDLWNEIYHDPQVFKMPKQVRHDTESERYAHSN